MKRQACVLLTVLLAMGMCVPHARAFPAGEGEEVNAARALIRVYPQADMMLELDGGDLYIILAGERLLYAPASGCPAPDPDASEDQPLCAMLAQPYPVGWSGRDPGLGLEPGRVRHERFMKLLYGENAGAVLANCTQVPFPGGPFFFNARHGAADALERVGKRLEALMRQEPGLKEYVLPGAGTVAWRMIQGARRLSAHSFGISLDLNVTKGPYWWWSKPGSPEVLDARANYPQAVVDAFEREGFIWGGKWHSFDFMHFEYRPELFSTPVRE